MNSTCRRLRKLVVFVVAAMIAITGGVSMGAEVVVPPVAEGMMKSGDFEVKVRVPGGEWREVPAYVVKVVKDVEMRRTAQDSSIAAFDFAGTVEVAVTAKAKVESVRVRPLSYGIKAEVKGETITFTLEKPRDVSIEINGDIFHNLQLFANPVEAEKFSADDPNVIYFGPGVHEFRSTPVASGKTVYVAAGAVLKGQLLVRNAENVRILGRGILLGAANKAILIESSKNVVVDGLIVVPVSYTVQIGSSQNVTIRNIKSFSAGGNNDGIDVFSSSDVVLEGLFMRNSDDCIAIYGHRWNYYGDVRNVTVKDSTLWADVAHPINIGTHGNSEKPETIENLVFSNLDILDQKESQVDYQGCMAINAGDSNLVRNVRFENIRVEDFREGQLVNLRVMYNRKYNTSAGRGIEHVVFKDVVYDGRHANLSVMAGYDEGRMVNDVVFENLRINGRVIADDMAGKPAWYKTGDVARMLIGEHVEGVVFGAGAGSQVEKRD